MQKGDLSERIFVSSDFSRLPELTHSYKSVYCLFDKNVSRYVEEISSLCDNIVSTFGIDATEENKSLNTIVAICKWLLDNNADRNSLLITVGGGLTSDMGGFAASIYKRGIRFAYMPTTLLSQVDAAIGGKTGVNFENYKNILGTIIQPTFTYINTTTLLSLPHRDFLSGAAEMLKTFIIADESYYSKAIDYLSGNKENIDIVDLISAAAKIKASIVEQDEFEHDIRRHLNLGHTFAHAIEWYQQTHLVDRKYTHGEAVSIGIVQAAMLSEKLSLCENGLSKRLTDDFKKCGMPTSLPCPISELDKPIFKDKKVINGAVHFVVIHKIGEVSTYAITRTNWKNLLVR